MVATARLGLNLQPVGSNVNTWGQILNDEAIGLLDEAVAGVETIALAGNYTLTSTNFVTNQARKPVLMFTSNGLVSAPTVTLPAKQKLWLFVNLTGFVVNFTCGGAPTTLPIGRTAFIICNGADLTKFDPLTDALAGSSASASQAATSATAAASAAGTATTARDTTLGYRNEALTFRNDAQTAATNAAASFDSFDDRYLGAKSSDPTLDNDGNTLLVGAIYFSTTLPGMKVWDGSAWGVFVPAAANYYTKTDIDTNIAAASAFALTMHLGS